MTVNETDRDEAVPTGATPDQTEAASPTADPGTQAETTAPEIAVAQLREENARLKDQLLRALAETENTRRRAERDREDTAKFATSRFAKDLLSVADNLRRALETMPSASAEDPALATIVEGVAATERELLSTFERHGITRIDPTDEKFDPNFHQAMFEVPNSGKAPGTVVQVMAPGYVQHGRLLRPAMVGVAAGEMNQRIDTVA